jgi:hypothetical protein
MKKIIYLFTLAGCVFSCKKNDIVPINKPNPVVTAEAPEPCDPTINEIHSYDTIFPSDYIMAYPGSWWEYDNGIIDSCTSWIPTPIRSTTSSDGCLFVDEDMWVLPEGLIYLGVVALDKHVRNPANYGSTSFSQLLDTVVGVFEETYGSEFNGGDSYSYVNTSETIAKLDSMIIGSTTYYDIIHVKNTYAINFSAFPGGPSKITQYWFAKNIGLIKWNRNDYNSTETSAELVDHHNAPY